MLERLEVKTLLVDEIHHALAGSSVKQRYFLNAIKYLGNEARIPVVLAGTEAAVNAIHNDEQFANRFPPALLPRWTDRTSADREEWGRLVTSFERRLPLRRPSRLYEVLSGTLLEWSEGKIGELTTLLSSVAVEAIRSGEERISPETLKSVGWVRPSERRQGGGDAAG